MMLYQMATLHANASVVAVLFSSNPLFVLVLAYLILHEPIYMRNVIALLLDIVSRICRRFFHGNKVGGKSQPCHSNIHKEHHRQIL